MTKGKDSRSSCKVNGEFWLLAAAELVSVASRCRAIAIAHASFPNQRSVISKMTSPLDTMVSRILSNFNCKNELRSSMFF